MFPLPLITPIILPRSRSRRIQRRRRRSLLVTARANQLVRSFNSLVYSFSFQAESSIKNVFSYSESNNFSKIPVTKLQARVLGAIYLNASKYISRLLASRGSSDDVSAVFQSSDLTYMNKINPGDFPSLDADKVSLPTQAATACILDLLPPQVASLYAEPCGILLPVPPSPPPQVRLLPSGTLQSEWVSLVKRLVSLGMVSFTREPKVVNGVFTVPKDVTKQRLIINAVPLNAMCVPPPYVSLPTPDVLARLRLPHGAVLAAGKMDRDNFYHRLVVPDWLVPYMALPPVDATELGLASPGRVYPCLRTLAMGWSHAVYLAQTLHEHQIDISGAFPLASRVSKLTDPYLDRLRHVVYIDDVGALGPCAVEGERAMSIYNHHMLSVGLPGKHSKHVPVSSQPLDLLGLIVSSDFVGVCPGKLERLIKSTQLLLRAGSCTGLELLSLVSSWTWALLVRRLSLSVFNAVYKFVHAASGSVKLWRSVRRELRCVIGLVPVLFTSWAIPYASRALASDASLTGFGVVSARVCPQWSYGLSLSHNAELGSEGLRHIDGLLQLLGRAWPVILAAPVRFAAHINVLEAVAYLLALTWLVSHARPCIPTRVFTLLDSSVVFYALLKGRTSSGPLLRVFRRISALALASNLYPTPVWVPSHLNPSDAPSRGR